MPRRRARRVLAGDDPRRDVALRERRARRPVGVLADRRADGEIGGAAREVVRREQLLRRVERSGGQEIHLTRERRAGEEIRHRRPCDRRTAIRGIRDRRTP